MRDVNDVISRLHESVSRRPTQLKSAMNRGVFEASDGLESLEHSRTLPSGPQDEFVLQEYLRPYFGKTGLNRSEIGTHPDFLALESDFDSAIKQYSVTLFVDIVGSTRLSLLYDLDVVQDIKNTILKTCIESIRSFDGYVHRLMGDAVMAFFGGEASSKEDSILNALNCCVAVRALLETGVIPYFEDRDIESRHLGFRIGCDFGDDSEVLWSNYGYAQAGEVTATGFPVDVAAKLQNLAPKKETMLGSALLEFIDFPDFYSKIKVITRDGQERPQPVLTPNMEDAAGNRINYSMRVLEYEKLLNHSALPYSLRGSASDIVVDQSGTLLYYCEYNKNGSWERYNSGSFFLEKRTDLAFFASCCFYGENPHGPLRSRFTKENFGMQASRTGEARRFEPVIMPLEEVGSDGVDARARTVRAKLPESTLYRGLHTMKCEILTLTNRVIFRDYISAFIK